MPSGQYLEKFVVDTRYSIIFFEIICSVSVNALSAYIDLTYALKIVLESFENLDESSFLTPNVRREYVSPKVYCNKLSN